MSAKNIFLRFSFLAICTLMVSSCSIYHAPKGWLPERKDVASEPYGGWLFVETADGKFTRTTQGEFIGVVDTTIYLLTERRLISIPFSEEKITHASLKINDDDRGLYSIWALAGIVGTPLLGGWLGIIFALPFWVVGGPVAASAESYSGAFITDNPSLSWWHSITPYSRFPQGIPAGLDLNSLKPKPSFTIQTWKDK